MKSSEEMQMMGNNARVDLHIHSSASDGQYTPAEIVCMAKEKGCELIAITDHDTVGGVSEERKCAEQLGVNFISGIEISAQAEEEIHILGYGINENNPELVEQCSVFAMERKNRAKSICDFLGRKNILVDMKKIQEIANGEIIARPHFAQYLQVYEYVSTRKEAFDKYLDTEEFHAAVTRNKPSPQEAIQLIHNAGGLAFLAHPGFIKKTKEELSLFVWELKKYGLDGIECFYSKHNQEQTKYFYELAEKYDLLVSCGSDFHGEKIKPEVLLGMSLNKNFYGKRFINVKRDI